MPRDFAENINVIQSHME